LRAGMGKWEGGATAQIYICHSQNVEKEGMIWKQCDKPNPPEETKKRK